MSETLLNWMLGTLANIKNDLDDLSSSNEQFRETKLEFAKKYVDFVTATFSDLKASLREMEEGKKDERVA